MCHIHSMHKTYSPDCNPGKTVFSRSKSVDVVLLVGILVHRMTFLGKVYMRWYLHITNHPVCDLGGGGYF